MFKVNRINQKNNQNLIADVKSQQRSDLEIKINNRKLNIADKYEIFFTLCYKIKIIIKNYKTLNLTKEKFLIFFLFINKYIVII